MTYSRLRTPLWVLIGLSLMVGVLAGYDRLVTGHENTAYGSYLPWGLWVSMYIYFISLSAGAFLMSALVYVFRVKALERIGRLALLTALVTLVASILHIWFDLGHMERFWRVYAHPNWMSVMNFMVWTYSLYFVILATEFFLAMKPSLWPMLKRAYSPEAAARDQRYLRILSSLGVPVAIAFHGGVGALFGVLGARPYWHVGMYPIMFLIAALGSGAAFLAFVVAFFVSDRRSGEPIVILLGRITLGLLLFEALFLFADYSQSVYGGLPPNVQAVMLVIAGPYWWAFWGVQIGLGTLIPIAILAHPRLSRQADWVAGAGLLVVMGFTVARINMILPALAVPELEALATAFSDPRLGLTYFPSLTEWGLTIGITGLAALLFLVGYEWLPVVQPASGESDGAEVALRLGG